MEHNRPDLKLSLQNAKTNVVKCPTYARGGCAWLELTEPLLPTSKPSEDARLARRQNHSGNYVFKVLFRVPERNSLNPLDLLVLERKRVSAIKEKSLTSVGFELTTSGSDHRRSNRLSYEANRGLQKCNVRCRFPGDFQVWANYKAGNIRANRASNRANKKSC